MKNKTKARCYNLVLANGVDARVADESRGTHGPKARDGHGEENAGDVDDVPGRASAGVVADHASGAHARHVTNRHL